MVNYRFRRCCALRPRPRDWRFPAQDSGGRRQFHLLWSQALGRISAEEHTNIFLDEPGGVIGPQDHVCVEAQRRIGERLYDHTVSMKTCRRRLRKESYSQVQSERKSSAVQTEEKSKSLQRGSQRTSPHHRFLIALHSPYALLETGLPICLPEKTQDSTVFDAKQSIL
jgi:hypothetical protein